MLSRHPIATSALGALLALVPLHAQNEKPKGDAGKLAELLEQLKALPPDAWHARVVELEAKIAAHTAEAAELRGQAEKLRQRAASRDAAAKEVRTEIEKLRALMALVAPKPAAKTPAAAPAKSAPSAATPPAAAPMPAKSNAKAPEVQAVSFAEHVFPIFDEHCTICHDDADTSGGLDLSNYGKALEGGGSGATIVPGRPDGSRLFRMITRAEKPFMPRDAEPLDDAAIETIRQWIALGAPEDAAAAKAAAERVAAAAKKQPVVEAAAPTEAIAPTMPESLPAVPLAAVENPPPLKTLATSPHAPLLAAAGQRQVLLIHADTLELLGVLPFALGKVEVLAFTRDGRRLLAAGGEPGARGGAILFDVATGVAVREFGPERDTVLAAAISPGQTVVALGGPSRKVHAYSTADGSRLYEIDAHNDWVLSAAISPDGNWIATADRAGIVEVRQADTGRPVHKLEPKAGAIHAIAFRDDGAQLAVAADDGKVSLWNVDDGQRVREMRHGRGALGVAWRANHGLVTSGDDGRVRIWNPNGKEHGRSKSLGDWVYTVAVASENRILVGDWNGRLTVLDDGGRVQRAITPTRPDVSQ